MASSVLFYTVFGFFVLPPLARVVAMNQLSKQFDRPVKIQKVLFNPYTFSVSVQGLLIQDKDGAPLVSWEAARVNFQLRSLFSHAWGFNEISLSKPFVRVQVNKDYRLNFSDLLDKFAGGSTASDSGKPSSWRINRLRFTGGSASFNDLTPRVPFQKTAGSLELTVTDFQTDSGHKNAFALTGISDGAERFSWKGSFYLAPLRSEGEVSVDGLALPSYAALYQDLFRFEIKDGVASFHSTYRYERSAATHLLAVTNTMFGLKSLQLVEKNTGQTIAAVSELLVSGANLDAMSHQAEADRVTVTGGRFVLRRNRDASVNAIELLKPAESAPPAPGGIVLLLRAMTNVVAMLLSTTNLSNGVIRELNLTNCTLHLEDLANSQPVRLELEGIAVQGRNISNRAGTNMTAQLSLRWDTNGTVRAGIKAGLSPANAEIELALEELNLQALGPYLSTYLDVSLLSGKLGLAGKVRWRSSENELPEVRFHGDAGLDGFSLAAGVTTEGLLRWNSLRLSGIEANLNPPVIAVSKARLDDVFGRLIIETNRTINLLSALRRSDTNAAPPLTDTNAVRPKVFLSSLLLSNVNVHFIDRSLRPSVNVKLEQLSGTLSGLSSDDPQRADLHLEGTVDQTARAEITGKINPWNSKQPLDLKVSLQGMNLLPEDPYSGKYLGYRLKKGELSAQLTYQVTEQKLKSENHVTIDQLTLGEKVDSADATTLPVRLAIALLKDRDGRIALEIPINGSLEDPQFNLGKVAYHAIETVLMRIVTSPFSSLGALFAGHGEELGFQDFQPGSAQLLPAAVAKLDVLANALRERPALQLAIEGSVDPITDVEALRRERLSEQLQVQQGSVAAKPFAAQTNAAIMEAPSVRTLEKTFAVEKGAAALRNQLPYLPAVASKALAEAVSTGISLRPFADDKGATALMLIFAPVGGAGDPPGAEGVAQDVGISPGALAALAAERAQNVRAYLLRTGKVEPQRLTESARGAARKGSRVYVRLQ